MGVTSRYFGEPGRLAIIVLSHDITKVDKRLSPKHFNADDSARALFDLTREVYFSVFHQEEIEFKASLNLLDLARQLKQDFELRHGVTILLLYS